MANEFRISEEKKENWYDNKDEVNVKMITSCLKTKPKKHQFQIQIANLTSSMSIESVQGAQRKMIQL